MLKVAAVENIYNRRELVFFYQEGKTKQIKTQSPGYTVFHVHAERCILLRQAVI